MVMMREEPCCILRAVHPNGTGGHLEPRGRYATASERSVEAKDAPRMPPRPRVDRRELERVERLPQFRIEQALTFTSPSSS